MSIFKFNDLNAESNVEGMRHQVVALYQEGLSKRKIAERLGKSTTFVTLAIEKWEAGMPLKDIPRSGRPRIHDARDERLLLRELNKDRELTGQEVQERALGQGRRIQKQSVEFCADVGSRR